jgi:hypothetical protein
MERFIDCAWVYVAGPYTKPSPTANTYKAIQVAEQLLKLDFFPIVPQVSLLWDVIAPHDDDFWYAYTMEQMRRCDAVLRMPGVSVGGDREVKAAKVLGLPVFFDILSLLGWDRSSINSV